MLAHLVVEFAQAHFSLPGRIELRGQGSLQVAAVERGEDA
jgi:hypothetical protein